MLDQKMALSGKLDVQPQVLQQLTGGRLAPAGPVPISVRFGGTLTAPQIEVVDIERTVAALAGALLRGQGKEILGGAAGRQLPGPAGQAVGKAVDALGTVAGGDPEAQRRSFEHFPTLKPRNPTVMRGRDPRIHLLEKDGLPGQARQRQISYPLTRSTRATTAFARSWAMMALRCFRS